MINKKFGSGRGFRLTMTGADEVNKRLAVLAISQREAFRASLRHEGDEIYNESQKRVPVDSGALQRSGKVKEGLDKKGNENSYVVAIGYGSRTKNRRGQVSKDYARYQHETNKTKAKYLEIPFMQALGGMVSRISARMKTYKG